jgi:hypothetical protein
MTDDGKIDTSLPLLRLAQREAGNASFRFNWQTSLVDHGYLFGHYGSIVRCACILSIFSNHYNLLDHLQFRWQKILVGKKGWPGMIENRTMLWCSIRWTKHPLASG